jgi:hypothetical protein
MRWITRTRPKIDRIACPWLIARFIDREPEFIFAPADKVLDKARALGAVPFDIPGVELSHEGEHCTFDTIIRVYKLADPALRELAPIVRGADTGELHLAPEAPGLLAVSLGLSALYANDHEMLAHGLVVYDALYAWICKARGETHNWPHARYTPTFRP